MCTIPCDFFCLTYELYNYICIDTCQAWLNVALSCTQSRLFFPPKKSNERAGRYDRSSGGVNHAFNFFEDPEDKEFHLIDSGPKTKRDFRPRRFQRINRRDQQAADRDTNPSGLDRERVRRMRQQQKQRQWQSSYWNQREQVNTLLIRS